MRERTPRRRAVQRAFTCVRSPFAATVGALVLFGIETWASIRTLAPDELAGSADKSPVMMTGAKGPPTSLYDDYSIVAY
jgi:hypothetical protein